MTHPPTRPDPADADRGNTSPMVVADWKEFRRTVGEALTHGPARVDQILFTADGPALLTVIGGDGTAYQLTYDHNRARTWVTAVRPSAAAWRAVRGAACDQVGFRLADGHPHLVYELLALAHHPMTIVRGTPVDFPVEVSR
ncbi:hypothetical protein AB0I95_10915 [Micromonospora sp. NPDC049751]|uniref:hypothetical protein n=1 Tax=Micromonospora sp. NPDC049751 TaxID=3154837 RepID=UPI0034118374